MTSPAEDVPPEFREAVAELLYHSQMIEALLRVYLSDVNEAADLVLQREGVRFKSRERDFQKPLRQLVRLFESHSDNHDLIRRLQSFVEHRNTAAHTAYVWGFVNRERPEQVAGALKKVRTHCAEGRALVEAITVEVVKTHELKTSPRLRLAAIGEKPDTE